MTLKAQWFLAFLIEEIKTILLLEYCLYYTSNIYITPVHVQRQQL